MTCQICGHPPTHWDLARHRNLCAACASCVPFAWPIRPEGHRLDPAGFWRHRDFADASATDEERDAFMAAIAELDRQE